MNARQLVVVVALAGMTACASDDQSPGDTTPSAETTTPTTAVATTAAATTPTTAAAATAAAPATTVAAAPTTAGVFYANCTEVRAAGAAPIRVGDPGYSTD